MVVRACWAAAGVEPTVFVRLRTLMVLAFIAMEVGFIFNLRIGLFPISPQFLLSLFYRMK